MSDRGLSGRERLELYRLGEEWDRLSATRDLEQAFAELGHETLCRLVLTLAGTHVGARQ